jgi:hypothetical protein
MASPDKTNPIKEDVAGRSGLWCWMALGLVIVCAAVIRGRLAGIPLERDEGEYAYIAQQMLKGVAPYASAYSMKLPGIDVVYTAILAVLGQTDKAIHAGLAVFNAATIFVIFLLGRRLFGSVAGVASACAYAIMSLEAPVLGLSANAEHFVILPALIGVLLIHQLAESRKYGPLFAAGLLMGLAFVIKQHGIFFAVFAAVYLLYFDLRHRPISWKKLIASQVVFAVGIIVPFVATCVMLWQAGVFEKFWFWTFTYAHKYVTSVPMSIAVYLFGEKFTAVTVSAILIWLSALAGLFIVIIARRYRQVSVFVSGLLIFSFLAVCPGFYFRGHYFIFLLPAVAILAGAGFVNIINLLTGLSEVFYRWQITFFAGFVIIGFSLFQQRTYLFDNTPAEVSRQIYGGNPFVESPRIAEYIKQNTSPDDTIAVIGSEPQIYFYSGRRAATHYIYMYPLMEVHDYAATMQKEMISEIESNRPEIMVFVGIKVSWLNGPGSVRLILEWFDSYSPKYYDLVGVVDIVSAEQTIYRWGREAVNYTPTSERWVKVYKRKH